MVLLATNERTLLGIEPFWDKPSVERPLQGERWCVILNLAVLAKEGISIDILRNVLPEKLTIPPEPVQNENVENSTTQTDRE